MECSSSTSGQQEIGEEIKTMECSSSTSGPQQTVTGNAFDGFVQQASESSATPTKKVPYDVFINHRGCDVKRTVASNIYHTLDLVGLHAFLDEESLDLGDSIPTEIQEAMTSAALHIAIFSVNYAQSRWCLDELTFMLKTGATIIPVFYHVKPEDLRWVAQGKGIYADAFSQHRKKHRYSSEIIQEWENALNSVSHSSGYILNKDNGNEGMMVKSIVNKVLKLAKKVPLEVAKYPVAMDEIVTDFERNTLQCGESEQHVRIVGIVGLGGSGKTTLATELYNRKCSSITRFSFLSNVRDAAAKNTLHSKQKKLLNDLRVQSESFDDINEGKTVIANRLRSHCVLIVVDDVDNEDQLDALLPPKDILGSGSLIIVTTREGSVLTKSGITSVYRMKELSRFHAKQLFCWHAFLRPSPVEGFKEMVEEFLNGCKGSPLALKVIGAQVYNKSKDYWDSQLCKIKKILPKEIKDMLRVSYDALDEDEREIFLDIACFFIGEEKSLAIDVWDASEWSGLCSWETLLNKCLVELDEKERIKMHDHIRDLGREIAERRSPSRFWFGRQNIGIQGGMLIRGMAAAHKYKKSSGCSLPFKEYMEMMRSSGLSPGLQLLVVRENGFTQEFAELSKDLVWLRWCDFEHKILPSWLSLESLRVLELPGAQNLEALWEDDAHPPLQLTQLMIGFRSSLKEFPESIGRLNHLKKISCQGAGLLSLPEEFRLLQSLEHLDLQGCSQLLSLPTHFGDLINLRHLNLSRCMELRMFPVSFKQLVNLEYLNFCYCSNLVLPLRDLDILEKITKLKVLDVSYCKKLQELPHHITNQANLRKLDLRGASSSLRRLPANIGQLSKLETLAIGSPLLTSLPTSLGNLSVLTEIQISGCMKLESLPTSLGNLSCLTTIVISDCGKLESLPESMGRLALLQHLTIKDSGVKDLPKEFRQLTNLQTLEIERCPLRELAFASGLGSSSSLRALRVIVLHRTEVCRISLPKDCCPSLEKFTVEYCEHLIEIETLPTSLKTMDLVNCGKLESLPTSLGNLSCLTTIVIFDCGKLESLPTFLGNLSCLTTIVISDCGKLESLPESMGRLALLQHLTIKDSGVKDLPKEFRQLTNLQTLEIERCPIRELVFASELGSSSLLRELRVIVLHHTEVCRISLPKDCCPSLEKFTVESCEHLIEIETLPTSLKEMKLIYCEMLNNIGFSESFEQMTNLQSVTVINCPITELSFGRGSSSSMCNLRSICLKGTHLSTISILEDSCPSLETFEAKHSEYLTEIEVLPTSLKKMAVWWCKMLKNIRGIGGLINLRELTIRRCPELDEMQSCAGLVSLKKFELINCEKMRKIEGLEHWTSLETLRAHTWWKAPGIESLEQMGRLRRVELIADNRSAIEPCIQTIIQREKWPGEMIRVCGRAIDNACSTLNSQSFPGLTFGNSVQCGYDDKLGMRWRLTCPKTHPSNVVITCFIIYSPDDYGGVHSIYSHDDDDELSLLLPRMLPFRRSGRWVLIGVHSQEECYHSREECHHSLYNHKKCDVVGGRLVVGEKGRIRQVLNQLFQLLEN